MVYGSHDPRTDIRSTIGTAGWTEEEGDIYYITVTKVNGESLNVPMYMSEEEKTESIVEMPYITFDLADCSYEPHDVGAVTRKMEAYIDIGVWFANTDDIDATSLGKKICDEIIEQVRTHQMNCTFPVTTTFVNIRNVRHLSERRAHQVVFHYVLELYVLFYDCCEP